MVKVQKFTFSPFQENTYVLYDETKECIIIDPGCFEEYEQNELTDFISKNGLTPVRLINTHCHLDHVFGNAYVAKTYTLGVECHIEEQYILDNVVEWALKYGLVVTPSPKPSRYMEVGETVTFGNTSLVSIFTPGHSPGSLSFYCEEAAFVIAGDALFQGSIGRTDLPKGDEATLLRSIEENLFTLPHNTKVYSGHGDETTIGIEVNTNPWFK